jgi:hypothetical protein
MHFDLFDEEHFGTSQDYGISRSRERRRKQQPGRIRIILSHCLMAAGWALQDITALTRA